VREGRREEEGYTGDLIVIDSWWSKIGRVMVIGGAISRSLGRKSDTGTEGLR
jgi:hypothetical protein